MNTLSSDLCSRLLNREQGILRFNERVLAMADDASVPLLERLRYVTIVSNNLDELFEIRVAELQQIARLGRDDSPLFLRAWRPSAALRAPWSTGSTRCSMTRSSRCSQPKAS